MRRRFERREPVLLLPLFVLSWASVAVTYVDGPPWIGWIGWAGLAALVGLLALWVLPGLLGYERALGLRILRRGGSSRVPWWVLPVALVLGGAAVTALHMGSKNPAFAILVALSTLLVVFLALARRYALFTTVAMFGIGLGVAALIVVQSVATGFQHEFERRVLGVYAHINVTRSFGIAEYRRFAQYLRTIDGVIGVSPFVYYHMALAPASGERGDDGSIRFASVLVKGIDPETAGEVMDLQEHLRTADRQGDVRIADLKSDLVLQPIHDRDDGKLPAAIAEIPDPRGVGWYERAFADWQAAPAHRKFGRRRVSDDEWPEDDEDDRPPQAEGDLPTMFVGATLARELGLSVGDQVMLVDPGASFEHNEAPAFRHYRVAGLFRAGFQEYDTRLIYVHVHELQYFKHRGKDIVSGIDLRLRDPYEAPDVERRLRQTIGVQDYSILEWQKLNANLFQSIRQQKSILTVILSLVIAVAGFNVLAALWTMVVRRTAEIAIMMAMGATEAGVARTFQFAGMAIGSVGSLAGVVMGFVFCWVVELYGYTLDPEVYFIERLPVEVSLEQVIAVLALTMGISFVATIPPSLRAVKLRPVEGLRYE